MNNIINIIAIISCLILVCYFVYLRNKDKFTEWEDCFLRIGGRVYGFISALIGGFILYVFLSGRAKAWPEGWFWWCIALGTGLYFILFGLYRFVKGSKGRPERKDESPNNQNGEKGKVWLVEWILRVSLYILIISFLIGMLIRSY